MGIRGGQLAHPARSDRCQPLDRLGVIAAYDSLQAACEWMAGDPDTRTRAELQALIDSGNEAELTERMAGGLEFGTAGIRGIVGAGSARMNRAVIIRTTRGLAEYLLATQPDPLPGPVVVGCDARLTSHTFLEDTLGVLGGSGIPVRYFPEPVATPIVAFTARKLDASAAVVITASHNPPQYNGYKVYASNAAQIIPPTDSEISAAIDRVGPANQVPRLDDPFEHDLVTRVPDGIFNQYLEEIDAVRPGKSDSGLRIVYTPLHGVGWEPIKAALHHCGYPKVRPVPDQVAPDGNFPTVSFPNPEEPGALDLAVALADEVSADLIIANDPDVDRLAVCLPADGTWTKLTGNQIGILLADFVLEHSPTVPCPLVISSVVSSPMLASIAEAHGARFEQTLTGFKWIWNAALDLEATGDCRFVFGYEEALGYSVGPVVRDKDGIGAAVAFADLTSQCRAEGRTVWNRLEDLFRRHGLWVSVQKSVVRSGTRGLADVAAAMAVLADRQPDRLGARTVEAVADFREGADRRPRWLPATSMVALDLSSQARVMIRPSGTEPKLKIYVDLRTPLSARGDIATAEQAALAEARQIAEEVASFIGLS